MNHVPGKEMYMSNILSRQLSVENAEKPMIDNEEVVHFLGSIIHSLRVSDVKVQHIIVAQADEFLCSKSKEHILEG